MQSVFPIISRLKKSKKNVEFLITTVTLSSGNLVKKKFGKKSFIHHRYFPVDVGFLIKRFLNAWKPNLILFVDSEIWPNLVFAIKKREIYSGIINGRITKKSFDRWMLVSRFAKEIFHSFNFCLAATKESREHLKKLGAKNLKYLGNIKLAGEIDIKKIENINAKILKRRKTWCAASTHQGEELFCLKTHLKIKCVYKNVLTIIIPRHISRSIEINLLCKKFNLKSQILNDGDKIQDKNEVVIINSFGVIPKYFKYTKSVFIGKSMIKKLQHVGGQSPIEAAKLGCKIYYGPYVYNFREIYDSLKSFNVAQQIKNEEDISIRLINDLKRPKIIQNKINKTIKNLGQNIMDASIKEINKFL